MKHVTTLLLALAAGSALAQPVIGLHLGSWHSAPGFNDRNPGAYLRWADEHGSGLGIGALRNSEGRDSVWLAYSFNTSRVGPFSAALSVGAITGYRAAPVLPMVTPSAALHIGESALRVSYLPKVYRNGAHALHFSIERKF